MPYRIDEPTPPTTKRVSAQRAAARAEAGWSLHALAWTYHAFGRALVPSLALLVIGALFAGVPQTAEVLRNLREPGDATAPLGSQTILWFDHAHWAFSDTDVLFLVQAVLTAGLLGAGAWLSMPGAASHDLPARLRAHPELRSWGDRHVTFIVTGALVLILGAFLQSGIPAAAGGSWGRNVVGWAWAATPVAGMLICRLVIETRGGGRRGWAVGAALLLWAGYSIGAVPAFGAGWRSSVINLVAALVPALACGLVSALLDVSRNGRWSLDHNDARWLQTLLLAMVVLLPVGLCVAVALAPPIIAQSYGSASLMLMQLGGLFAVGILLSAGGRLLFHEVPGATLFAAVVVLSLLWWWTPERYGQEHLPAPVSTEPLAAQGAKGSRVAPLDARRAAWAGASPGPHVAVHADGGGIRAAYFTAMVLARADDLTCGAFGARVFAASGVSGGSLGLAAWAVLRQELVERRAPDPATSWQACERAKAEGRTPPPLLQDLVRRTLVRDHLSPVLARMVGTDAVPAYHRPAQRGQALLDSWQSAATEALTELGLQPASVTAFARPLAQTTAGLDPAPWLLLNATDALTGQRVVQLNAASEVSLATPGGREPTTTAVGVATLDSARFPYISPAGDVPSTTGAPRRLLVDGGYFDNSGAASLRDLLLASDVAKPKGTVKIVRIDGNPSNDERTRCERLIDKTKDTAQEHPAWAGLSAYFNARNAHADEAVASLRALASRLSNPTTTSFLPDQALTLRYAWDPGGANLSPATAANGAARALGVEACQVSLAAVQAPLGWYMGRGTAGFMQRSIEAAAEDLMKAAGLGA